MQAWARAVAQRLGELLELGDRFRESTVHMDAGADRVVLAEAPDGTSPASPGRGQHQDGTSPVSPGRGRVSIALSIDDDFVEVAAHLPAGEAPGVRERIADPLRALELTTALEALPEQFTLGVAGEVSSMEGLSRQPPPTEGSGLPEEGASRFTLDRLRALLLRTERTQRPLWLGWRIPRDLAVEHAALLDEQLEDAAVALGAVFPLLLGPTTGPDLGPPHVSPLSQRHDRRHASPVDDDPPGAKRRPRGRDRDRERDGGLSEQEAPEREADSHSPPVRVGSPRATTSSRARPPRAGRGAGKRIEAGARVRVLEGPFSGKVGVVQELDGKGGARVLLGLLAVRLDVRDLARSPEGRARPILSTSHRKPAPARS